MEKVVITQAQYDELVRSQSLIALDGVFIHIGKFRKIAAALIECGWSPAAAYTDALNCFARVESQND